MLSGAKLPSIQENTAETGAGTVIETAPAPVFCVLTATKAQYFCLLSRAIKGNAADIGGGFEVKNSALIKRVTKKYGLNIYFSTRRCYNY